MKQLRVALMGMVILLVVGRIAAQQPPNDAILLAAEQIEVGAYDEAITALQAAVDTAVAEGDTLNRAHGNFYLGEARFEQGKATLNAPLVQEAFNDYNRAVVYYRESGERHGEADALHAIARTYIYRENYPEAINFLRTAVNVARTISYQEAVARIEMDWGDVSLAQGELVAANDHYVAANAVLFELMDNVNRSEVLVKLGDVNFQLWDLPLAEGFYNEAAALFSAQGRVVEQADVTFSLGIMQERQGNLEQAVGQYEAALTLYESVEAEQGRARSLARLGALYHRFGYANALQIIEEAENAQQVSGDQAGIMYTYIIKAEVLYDQRDYLGAEQLITRALGIANNLGDINAQARTYLIQAKVFTARDNIALRTALDSFGFATERYRYQLKDPYSTRRVFIAEALARETVGEFGTVETLFQQALNEARVIEDLRGETEVHLLLGQYHQRRLNDDTAVRSFEAALVSAQAFGDNVLIGDVYIAYGDLLMRRGNFTEALERYEAGRSAYRQANDLLLEALAFNRTAEIIFIGEDFITALARYRQARELWAQTPEPRDEQLYLQVEAEIAQNLGQLYLTVGQYDRASAELEAARLAWVAIGNLAGLASVDVALGELNFAQGNYGVAETQFTRARDNALESGDLQAQAGAELGLAQLYALPGETYGTLFDAQTFFQFATNRYREAGDPRGQQQAFITYAHFERDRRNNPQQAELFLREALETAQIALDQRGRGNALIEIGLLKASQNEYDQAIALFQDAVAVFGEANNWRGEGRALRELGRIYQRIGENAAALDAYGNMQVVYQQGGDRTLEGEALLLGANVLRALGNYPLAGERYQLALESIEDPSDDNELQSQAVIDAKRSEVYRNLAEFYIELEQFALADENLTQAVTILGGAAQNSNARTYILVSRGELALASRDYSAARQNFQEAKNLAEANTDDEGLARACYGLGRTLAIADDDTLGSFQEADTNFQCALQIYRTTVPNPRLEQQVALGLGDAYVIDGNYSRAEEFYSTARLVAERTNDTSGQGIALINLARLNRERLAYTDAISLLEQAVANFARSNDRLGEALARRELGDTYVAQVSFEEALQQYGQARLIYQEVNDPLLESLANSLIGDIYFEQTRFALALERHLASRDQISQFVRENADDPLIQPIVASVESVVLRNIARTQIQLGQLAEARSALERSLSMAQTANDTLEIAVVENLLGQVSFLEGNEAGALELYTSAEAAFSNLGEQRRLGEVRLNIGEIWLVRLEEATGDRLDTAARAEFAFNNAWGIAREVGDPLMEAQALNGLGRVLLPLGIRRDDAAIYLRDGLVKAEESGSLPQQSRLLTSQGLLAEANGETPTAINSYEQAINLIEQLHSELRIQSGQVSYIEDNILPYHRIVLNLLGAGDERAFEFAERGRARTFLYQLGNEQLSFGTDNSADLLGEWQLAREQVNELRQRQIELRAEAQTAPSLDAQFEILDEVDAMDVTIRNAEFELGAVEERIRLENTILGQFTRVSVPTVPEIQAAIPPDTAVVSYYIIPPSELDDAFGGQVVAFVLTAETLHTVELDVSPAQINDLVAGYRENYFSDSLVQLHEDLIQPLHDHPEGDLIAAENLVMVPHSVLNYLPFGVLTPDGEAFLADDKVVSYAPTATVFALLRQNSDGVTGDPNESVLLLGDPDFRELPALPFAEEEVNQVGELLGVTPLVGEMATETSVWMTAAQSDVIHIAAHGVLDLNNPLSSYVGLTSDLENNGRLEVREIYSLPLRQNAPLVVLSACETVIGRLSQGDEFQGLTRAFLLSGANGVVASLWQVDDATTARLMVEFHRNRREGMSDAAALTAAQRVLREDGVETRNWAAFIYVGP